MKKNQLLEQSKSVETVDQILLEYLKLKYWLKWLKAIPTL